MSFNLSDCRIIYTYDNGSVTYSYEFTELSYQQIVAYQPIR